MSVREVKNYISHELSELSELSEIPSPEISTQLLIISAL